MKRKLLYLGAFILVGAVYLLIVLLGHPTKTATLYLQGFAAFWQTVIAISAIWGNEIKALFLGPKLVLELDRPEGQLTRIRQLDKPARYFHLRVRNKRTGTPAIHTQIILYSIVPPHKEGTREPLTINGRLPFPWKFGQGKRDSVIGPDDYCDLALLEEGGILELQAEHWTLVEDFLDVRANEKTTIEVIAIAENGQSNLLRLDISWDGEWPTSDEDVKNHVVIEKAKRRH